MREYPITICVAKITFMTCGLSLFLATGLIFRFENKHSKVDVLNRLILTVITNDAVSVIAFVILRKMQCW